MYLIVVYDVGEERVGKVCKFMRRYLPRVQNSVFEGELPESKLEAMKAGPEQTAHRRPRFGSSVGAARRQMGRPASARLREASGQHLLLASARQPSSPASLSKSSVSSSPVP